MTRTSSVARLDSLCGLRAFELVIRAEHKIIGLVLSRACRIPKAAWRGSPKAAYVESQKPPMPARRRMQKPPTARENLQKPPALNLQKPATARENLQKPATRFHYSRA